MKDNLDFQFQDFLSLIMKCLCINHQLLWQFFDFIYHSVVTFWTQIACFVLMDIQVVN